MMTFQLEYTKDVTDYETITASIQNGQSERVLTIRQGRSNSIAFHGVGIGALHDALHDCAKAFVGLERTASKMAGWAPQPEPTEADSQYSQEQIAMLRELATGKHMLPTHLLFQPLYHGQLLHRAVSDCYTISDKGRAVLAEHG